MYFLHVVPNEDFFPPSKFRLLSPSWKGSSARVALLSLVMSPLMLVAEFHRNWTL